MSLFVVILVKLEAFFLDRLFLLGHLFIHDLIINNLLLNISFSYCCCGRRCSLLLSLIGKHLLGVCFHLSCNLTFDFFV